MSSKNLAQSEQLYRKVLKLSADNKKLLESLSSHLILQSSYLDKHIKGQTHENDFTLHQKYELLLTSSNETMEKNEIFHNQFQQKQKYIQTLKQQIDQYEMESLKIDHQMTKSERKLMQEEELQKQYQFQLMKKNTELKKELNQVEETEKCLIQQNSLYERESIQLHQALQNANHQLKQSDFVYKKKQEEQESLIAQLDDLKRQMTKKKQKLVKNHSNQSQPKQKNNKNQIIKEIDQIQSLISNYKRNKKTSSKQ